MSDRASKFHTIAQGILSIVFVLLILLPELSQAECLDPDGDGYGWNGDRACRTRKFKPPSNPEGLKILDHSVVDISKNSARLVASFTEKAAATIKFGKTQNHGQSGAYTGFLKSKNYSQVLTKLEPDTTYYYQIEARNRRERVTSSQGQFTTLKEEPPIVTTTSTTTTTTTTTTSPTTTTIQSNTSACNSTPDSSMLAIVDAALGSHKSRGYVAGTCKHPTSPERFTSTTGYFNYGAFLGLDTAYRATSNLAYVDAMYEMAEKYIDGGRKEDGDQYNDWWSCNKNGFLDHHFEWRAAGGIGVLLKLLIEKPELSGYNQAKLANHLRDHVWDKWSSGNSPDGRHYYNFSQATYMLARMIPVAISLNMYYGHGSTSPGTPGKPYIDFLTGPGSVVWELEKHLLHPANQDAATGASNFWGRVNPAPGSDVSGTLSPNTVDISHAQDFVVGLIMAGEAGMLNDLNAVVDGLSAALNEKIWDGSKFTFYVDGKSTKEYSSPKGWLLLTRYDKQNLQAYRSYIKSNVQQSSNSHPSRLSSAAYLLCE